MNRAAWAWIASTTCGWQWPVLVTAMPLEKSRYSSPLVVVTTQPRPEATSRSVTLNQTSETCSATRASSRRENRRQPTDPAPLPSGPMLDLRRIRTDPDAVRAGLSRRGGDAAAHLDRILALDTEQRALGTKRDELRAQVKLLSKEVGRLRGQGDTAAAEAKMAESRALGDEEKGLDAQADALAAEVRDLLLRTPNIPAEDCPDGAGEADNVVLRLEGFDPDAYGDHQRVPHWDIGTELGIIDGERAAKISGSMFTMYRGWGARLLRGMVQLSLDRNAD